MTELRDFPQAKCITCILPDEGKDMELIKALRRDKGIITANTFQCRGFSHQLRGRYSRRRQLATHSVRVVTLVVSEQQADDIFEYVYHQVNSGHLSPGLVYQGDLLAATPYALPEGVQEERGE